MEESKLIRKMQQGNMRALEALIRQYTPYVGAVIYRVMPTLPKEDREEVAADTFVALWEHAGELEPDRGTLRAWLGTVAANRAKNRLRSYAPPLPLDEGIPDAGTPEGEMEERELGELLWREVDTLGEPERTLFLRYYYEGEKLRAVAADLGMNPSTAKTKLARGRKLLRERLRRKEGEQLV